MDKKTAVLNIVICTIIGGIIAYFTNAKWLAASLRVFAALFIKPSETSYQ